ncbi:hypothetical protein EDD11_005001 [Mortierella claussenii]|nr:hypothetical protein EDD11_005001 [Mortierella claussenii]
MAASYPRLGPILKEAYGFTGDRSSTRDQDGLSASASFKDLEDSFRVIYRHLHEKHYLDRIVHALYVYPNGRIGASKRGEITSQQASTITFKLRYGIKQACESPQDLSLLLILLTEPVLRFRLCAITHLLEVAMCITNDFGGAEQPRLLASEELVYVLEKLRDIFTELFQQPLAQASLRRFLTILAEWSAGRMGMKTADEDETEPEFPAIVKDIFPCYSLLFLEYRNLLDTGKGDNALLAETRLLFKFMMLSLRSKAFLEASDWTSEGRAIIFKLRDTLRMSEYRGPAQRLIRNLVSMTHQLWEGGGTTDTSLAIEHILATVIQKSVRGASNAEGSQGVNSGLDEWNVMAGFERLVRAASAHSVPIPLPSIAWRRENSELCLDAMVIHFPHLMPSNIKLNSSVEFDRQANQMRRHWHLRIFGLEMEARKVPFYYVTNTRSRRHLVDVGELSFSVPLNSLEIDLKFTLTPPNLSALRRSQERHAGKHPIASVAQASLAGNGGLRQGAVRDTPVERSSAADGRTSDFQDSKRRLEPLVRVAEAGQTIARTSAQLGQRVTREVVQDARSTTRVISGILYPHQTRRGRPSVSGGPYRALYSAEETLSDHVPSIERGTWRCPRRQLIYGAGRLYRKMAEGDNEHEGNTEADLTALHPAPLYGIRADEDGEGRERHLLLDIKECTVRLRQVNMKVHETKHPLLQTFAHAVVVRRLRKAIERATHQAIMDIIMAINDGAEEIMQFSKDELKNRHGPTNASLQDGSRSLMVLQGHQQP